eukprot:scaffold31882_cov36-Tisochrysis_lutea.AAC.1
MARLLASAACESASVSTKHRAVSRGRVEATDSIRNLRRPTSSAPSAPSLVHTACVARAPVYLLLLTGPPRDCDPAT